MIYNNVYIESINSFFPTQYNYVEDAIDEGIITKTEADTSGFKKVSIARDIEFKDICLLSCKNALEKCEDYENNLNTIYLTYTHWHGNNFFWSPASYIQEKLNLKTDCTAYNIQQGCNGLFAAIEQSATRIAYLSPKEADSNHIIRNLVVGADKFSNTHFNRWKSDTGLFYGDGSASVVLTNIEKSIQIISLNTLTDSSLEVLHRISNEKNIQFEGSKALFEVKETKIQGLAKLGVDYLINKTQENIRKCVQKTLFEANLSEEDISFIILPNLGESILNSSYRPAINQNWVEIGNDFHEKNGHLGTIDSFVKIHSELVSDKHDFKDKYALLIGSGSGFSWSALLLKFN